MLGGSFREGLTFFSYCGGISGLACLHETVVRYQRYWSNGVCVFRANNRIGGISEEQLRSFSSLQTLDFSNNKIVEIKMDSFPALPLRNL